MPFRKVRFFPALFLLLLVPAFHSTASAGTTLLDSVHANVDGLTLDRTVLRGTGRSRLVKVWTLAADPENDLLI